MVIRAGKPKSPFQQLGVEQSKQTVRELNILSKIIGYAVKAVTRIGQTHENQPFPIVECGVTLVPNANLAVVSRSPSLISL
jgi:hypothetical protein